MADYHVFVFFGCVLCINMSIKYCKRSKISHFISSHLPFQGAARFVWNLGWFLHILYFKDKNNPIMKYIMDERPFLTVQENSLTFFI